METVSAKQKTPAQQAELWVFGYGSLMWRPGFPFIERAVAVIHGFHRALCIYSHVHRGTAERPGVVLGLDRGGSCRGIAYCIAEQGWPETLAYLRAREQATAVYLERTTPAVLLDGRRITALAYVADRRHPQYAGKLERRELLRLVQQGEGLSGKNPDYVHNTHEHLADLGVIDATLAWLSAQLR
jgi:cation transport protein ChaC